MNKRRAVFLDRDGTINVDSGYLSRAEQFEFIPGIPGALGRLQSAGFLLVVVTNQSGVARGFFDLAVVEEIHQHMLGELSLAGVELAGIYVCPHHPDGISGGEYSRRCDCRKGQPGMLLQAAKDLHVDLSRSFMVGDKLSDLEAGYQSGCVSCLVTSDRTRVDLTNLPPYCATVCTDLNGVADFILAGKPRYRLF